MTTVKYKYRLDPRASLISWVIQYSYLEKHYFNGIETERWSRWYDLNDYKNEPYCFAYEDTARGFIKDYKEWLEKEPIEIE